MNDQPHQEPTPAGAGGADEGQTPNTTSEPAAAVDGDTPPSSGTQPGARRRWQVAAAVAVAAILAGVGIATVMADEDDGDDDVRAGSESPSTDAATAAVTFGYGSEAGEPVDLTLRFLDAAGDEVATRSWSEVEEQSDDGTGQAGVTGGLLQEVPAGDLQLEATLQQDGEPLSCTQSFSATAGEQVILRLEEGTLGYADLRERPDVDCAAVEPVDDWVRDRTSATGEPYLGLTEAEATAQAEAAGLTTRVVGLDGMNLAMTMDLRTDRLDLLVFDDVVVAAQLGGEPPLGDAPDTPAAPPVQPGNPDEPVSQPGNPSSASGTLAVDLETIEGRFIEGFDVTLRFYAPNGELLTEREWSDSVEAEGGTDLDAYYTHVLRETVPAGPIRLVTFMRISPGGAIPPPEGPGCETGVEVPSDDTARVTLLFDPDGTTGDCAAVSAATSEADELLAMPRGLPAPGFVGLGEDEAESTAAARGWTVRVVARDGESFPRTEDYSEQRVNLVIDDGVATAAARS